MWPNNSAIHSVRNLLGLVLVVAGIGMVTLQRMCLGGMVGGVGAGGAGAGAACRVGVGVAGVGAGAAGVGGAKDVAYGLWLCW